MQPQFSYGTACVRDLQAVIGPHEKNAIPQVTDIELGGRRVKPTARFWRSFFGRFRFSENVFRYFSHAEVFQRISERAENERFRYCLETGGAQGDKLLAVTNPQRPIISYVELEDLVRRHGGQELRYSEGIAASAHTPRSGDFVVDIGGDRFQNRYVLETPVDGYGLPRIHLSLLRLICTNGAVGYTPAFRSEINVGNDPLYSIARALENYDNDNGYAALRDRFESAQRSWASLHETQELYSLLVRLAARKGFQQDSVLNDFYNLTGRVHELYGLANLDTFSVKRQRVLPAKCRVYDLINFASEVATHRAQPQAAAMLQAYIGDLISDEYDMEGTAERVTDFQDFFVTPASPQPPASPN